MQETDGQEQELSSGQIEDLRLAASKLRGADRRNFQAQMTLKYCRGSARIAERVFGWGRAPVEVGLGEHRSGIVCVGAQSAFSGSKRWEEKHPEAAATLRQIAEAHAQQDPTFKTTIAYTRLTAQAAIDHLREQGFEAEQIPANSTMAGILNRMGYRLKPVVKAIPQKNFRKPTRSSTTLMPKTAKVTTAGSND
jgi:Rhodopirellula transposase DDE domain